MTPEEFDCREREFEQTVKELLSEITMRLRAEFEVEHLLEKIATTEERLAVAKQESINFMLQARDAEAKNTMLRKGLLNVKGMMEAGCFSSEIKQMIDAKLEGGES